jgi:hypothetical protein
MENALASEAGGIPPPFLCSLTLLFDLRSPSTGVYFYGRLHVSQREGSQGSHMTPRALCRGIMFSRSACLTKRLGLVLTIYRPAVEERRA